MTRTTPRPTLFPYTTLFRSREAIAQALAHNPQLDVARAQVGQARARKVEATALPDPEAQSLRPCADRKSTRLNSSHRCISYAVFCLKKKKQSAAALAQRYSE